MKQIEYLIEIARKGGPDPWEYGQVATCFEFIMKNYRDGKCSSDDLRSVAHSLGDVFSLDTTQGWVLQKPYGYAGDFELIDRIYMRFTSPYAHLTKWDLFAHSRKSNQAVRNRKDYFVKLLEDRTRSASSKDFRVLNVGSGPGRDVFEFLEMHNNRRVTFDCLDKEPLAVEHAKKVCAKYLNSVSFISGNVFRFNPPTTYSLVWSAGLFDYLDDRSFLFLLKRLCSFSASDGEVVVGNFSPRNPDQDYMAFGGWILNHRTPEQLLKIVADSKIDCESLSINSEEEGINLFLHLNQPRNLDKSCKSIDLPLINEAIHRPVETISSC